MKKFEEVQVGIKEVGAFSEKLGEILQYLLNETKVIREEASKENDARKSEIEKRCGDLSKKMEEDSTAIKDIIKRQNEERKMEMKDIEY